MQESPAKHPSSDEITIPIPREVLRRAMREERRKAKIDRTPTLPEMPAVTEPGPDAA